jgi:putative ABC transport system substrate-binding protein
MGRLSRRQFVAGAAGLGVLAGCGRLPWQGQAAPARVPRIGLLTLVNSAPHLDAFQQGLRDHGWINGQTIGIEVRSAEGQADQLSGLANGLVRLQVDLIVATNTPAAQAAKQATGTIPIVFTRVGDPVRTGLVASLAHPGGNVTGVSIISTTLSTKLLDLLKQAFPTVSSVAYLWNPANDTAALAFEETQAAAQTLGVQFQSLEVRAPQELGSAFGAATREHADALVVWDEPTVASQYIQIVDFATKSRLPTIGFWRDFVVAGGLMSYGPNLPDAYRRAAYYVDRILKGAKPADLPVEQPMTFDFVVNMKTAQALGITFPNEIMLQVTEVIQ